MTNGIMFRGKYSSFRYCRGYVFVFLVACKISAHLPLDPAIGILHNGLRGLQQYISRRVAINSSLGDR
jgi:hypothetical protein